MDLKLKRTGSAFPRLDGPDDYLVIEGDVAIGRISKHAGVPERWGWSNEAIPNLGSDRGTCDTLDDATAAFRARWEEMTEEQRNSARDQEYWTKHGRQQTAE